MAMPCCDLTRECIKIASKSSKEESGERLIAAVVFLISANLFIFVMTHVIHHQAGYDSDGISTTQLIAQHHDNTALNGADSLKHLRFGGVTLTYGGRGKPAKERRLDARERAAALLAAKGTVSGAAASHALDKVSSTVGYQDTCHAEEHAEYDGECTVVKWGADHLVPTRDDCCAACRKAHGCNVWVYCDSPEGCGSGYAERKQTECWLKSCKNLDYDEPFGRKGPGTHWTSGLVYSEDDYKRYKASKQHVQESFQNYLTRLAQDERLPMVYMKVSIRKKPIGVIKAVLFSDICPRAAENYRRFFACDKPGVVPPGREGAGQKYCLGGKPFYRIIDQFIDQTGVGTISSLDTPTGRFNDDPACLKLKHDRKGLLSVANLGINTTTSHFSIMMNRAPHLNGNYEIFGQVVEGFEVMDAVNRLSLGKKDNTATGADGALIEEVGQIRKGTLVPDLDKY